MDPNFLTRELSSALGDALGLPAADVESIDELIRVGEWEVALETLCTQVSEYDLEVTAEQKSRLDRLGRLLLVPVNDLL